MAFLGVLSNPSNLFAVAALLKISGPINGATRKIVPKTLLGLGTSENHLNPVKSVFSQVER